MTFAATSQQPLSRSEYRFGFRTARDNDLHDDVHEILRRRNLTALFQPILCLRSGDVIGVEGSIRGPANSYLHAPVDLFHAAQRCGLSLEIEMLCQQIVLEAFAQQKLSVRLFLNVSPLVLTHPSFKDGQTLDYMRKFGIRPDQVTIEITENQPTADINSLREALLHYRSMGFMIALDDLGDGFSSLRLWSELHPEFVKVDKHFIHGVDNSLLKRQFLQSFQQIAERSGHCQIIAKGIETEAELKTLKSMGVALGQGHLIARPGPTLPAMELQQTCRCVAELSPMLLPAETGTAHAPNATAQHLLRYIEPVSPDTENSEIFSRFSADPSLPGIPVVKHGEPVCLINRHTFMERFARPSRRELPGNTPCVHTRREQPLLVEKCTTIQEISLFLTETHNRHFADGFIITEDGKYLGVGTWQDLLREITRMQIEAVRHADPLTHLPGNVPINGQIRHLLQTGTEFHACYCDLDNFKPFNDAHGYQRGDELIQLTARILRGVCDPLRDFVGHIGGDDFILLMQSRDWEKRCDNALRSFAHASLSLSDEKYRCKGGYESKDRRENLVFHPLPTISIGAVHVDPEKFNLPVQIMEAAREARKMAGETPCNGLFIERRLHETAH
jgi:diguanylate cyclase (GGDEF)-like protein